MAYQLVVSDISQINRIGRVFIEINAVDTMGKTSEVLHNDLPTFNMQTVCSTIFLLVFIIALEAVDYWKKRHIKLPPGPWGVPILGVLPLMGKKRHVKAQQWWEKYGDVYSAYFGSRLVVVINGIEAMKECFIKQADTFSDRPMNYFKKLTRNTGIVFTDGDVWQEHRRFTLSCMRDFGMGRVSLEAKIHEESRILLDKFSTEGGQPFDVRKHLPKAVSNIICSIIYGSRFDYSDPVFQANIQALDYSVRNQSLLGMIQFLPFLEILPKLVRKDKELARNVKLRDDYATEQLDRHLETFDVDNPRDFIDAYFSAMSQKIQKGERTTFEDKQLKRTIQDLFIAGTETTNTTMKWSLLFMALNPEVQRKVQEEIDEIIGSSRLPTMKDKPNMPYTEATLLECQRLGNIALFSVPRCVTRDTKVNGYDIPKGTWVFTNRWGMHATSRYWINPRKFDPTRFLKNGQVHKPDTFVPFGIGPRSCLGEVLAKMELFLFFTSILQAFAISLPKNQPAPSLEPVPGINMSPAPYNICMNHR